MNGPYLEYQRQKGDSKHNLAEMSQLVALIWQSISITIWICIDNVACYCDYNKITEEYHKSYWRSQGDHIEHLEFVIGVKVSFVKSIEVYQDLEGQGEDADGDRCSSYGCPFCIHLVYYLADELWYDLKKCLQV